MNVGHLDPHLYANCRCTLVRAEREPRHSKDHQLWHRWISWLVRIFGSRSSVPEPLASQSMKYNRFIANCGTKMYDQQSLEDLLCTIEFCPQIIIVDDDHIELGVLWSETVYWWNTGPELVSWLEELKFNDEGRWVQ